MAAQMVAAPHNILLVILMGKLLSMIIAKETIYWLDYGPDDYAGVTWSNTGNQKSFYWLDEQLGLCTGSTNQKLAQRNDNTKGIIIKKHCSRLPGIFKACKKFRNLKTTSADNIL